MMLKKTVFIAVALIALFCVGCESFWSFEEAKDLYARGDKVGAALATINALYHDPQNKDAIAFYKIIIPEAIDDCLSKIESLRAGDDQFKWTKIVGLYRSIHKINDGIKSLKPIIDPSTKTQITFVLTYYEKELNDALPLAAQEQYTAAASAEYEATRAESARARLSLYREAYRYYMAAMSFVGGYRDSSERAEACRLAGSDRLVVSTFFNRYGYFFGMDLGTNVSETILVGIVEGKKNKTFLQILDRSSFDKVMTEQHLMLSDMFNPEYSSRVGNLVGANVILVGQVSSVTYEEPRITTRTEQIEREISYTDSTGATVVEKVYATVVYWKKTTRFEMTASYRLVDVETMEIIDAKELTESRSDECEWLTFTGDVRALDSAQISLSEQYERTLEPSTKLAKEAAEKISKKIADLVLAQFE